MIKKISEKEIFKEKIFIGKKKAAFLILTIFILISISILYLISYEKQKVTVYPLNQEATVTPTIPLRDRLDFDAVFSYKSPESFKSENNSYVILVTGDVILARSVNATMIRKNNFLYPFEKTAEFLRSGDVLFINLETPLFSGCPVTDAGMIFCGSDRAIEGLKYAGIKVVSLANNHSGNYGKEGIDKTVELLEKNGISVTGLRKPAIIQLRDKKFGFLGYDDVEKKENLGISLADPINIASAVTDLKKQADFVIVIFHWGVEYTDVPNDRQKELAHSAVDAGADLIVGNHPHWVQGIEVYKNKLVTYAHGNFIFDQMWSQETREGVIGKYVFDKTGLTNVSFYPVVIENYSQPRFADEQEAEKILGRMKEESIFLESRLL